ncbi:DNA polymerase I [Ruminococcus sp. MSJ-25]|uniref:DNA polymerase I n=1 Tax=Ruminococcus sp. MSJ-25 TaxID=2841536 RepID=UPI001C10FD69|nr:DNA polymerase I [Ruminococcus sp. MSJ-25]MBU5407679.1 DNA polymerase I [Ruminococcus sp. MSJ-25]
MKLLAIDGNSIMNRAFYGIKLLSNSKGQFTNALTGFMNIYLKEIGEVKPDCVAVAFDLKAPTFRHKANAAYKANRKGMPEELAQQMPVIKELLGDLGIKIVQCEGYEADDILGTLSKAAADSGNECYILTGDRDSFQLVSDRVTVRLATTKETKIYTPDRIMEEYGVTPRQMIEVKALMGDTSDNISGVKGIGEKTALSLIKQEGDVKTLYEHLTDIKLTPSVRTKLENGHQDAIDSRFLAEICLEAPVEKATEFYKLGEVDTEKTKALLADLEMMRLIDRLGLSGKAVESADSAVQESKLKLSDLPKFEVKPLDESVISVLGKDKTAYFIFADNKLSILCNDVIYTTEDNALITAFMGTACEKITFEGKTAHKFAFSNGTHLENLTFCCDLAGYLLNSQSSEYTAENLCLSYKCLYRSDMGEYADLSSLPALSGNLKKQLEMTEMTKLFDDIEMPLCEVLASMEFYGVKADAEGIKAFGEDLKIKIDELTSQIYMYAGKEFNIASTKQLGEVLFEDLGLPAKKKTKSGYSTNADVLESLMDKHPIVPLIVEYRTLTKLNSTYVDGLLKLIHPDGRVHSVFKQTETRTGRISSTEPNMQNIPVRKEIGRNMRKFFVAEDGYTLLDADYSQIELRVLASVCGDKNMQEAFSEGRDIHTSTAAQVFDIPEDFLTPEMRSAAKAVNFGIIYGIGAFSLSKDIGVTVAEAKRYIKNYLDNFPKVSEFMDKTVDDGIKNGYVTTLFGRRRYIPELSASNKVLQAFGKRAAMNAPIQGAAADIIKIAMVRVYKKLREEDLDARLILQVHDELIIEAAEKDKDRAEKILKDEMENAVKLAVPMTVDVNSGRSWYEAKD